MRAGLALLAGVWLAVAAAGCGSSARNAIGSGSSTSTSLIAGGPGSSTSSSSVVTSGHLPTVPNCGGGAYEPRTLLIVCGVDATMVTYVSWTSWTATTAHGTGTVQLKAGGRSVSSPAGLVLDDVVSSTNGPQYSMLTVTWTGSSPDGHPTDTYHLSVGVP